jgi:hypothetical protein
MIEVSRTLYLPNNDMYSVVRKIWGNGNNVVADIFIAGLKDSFVSTLQTSFENEYLEHPGFGGHTDRVY